MNITLPAKYNFVPRFYRLAIANILSNLMVPLAGLISVAFLGHLQAIDALAGVSIANILLRSMARELAPYGITVNAVAPGWIPVERHEGVSQEKRMLTK